MANANSEDYNSRGLLGGLSAGGNAPECGSLFAERVNSARASADKLHPRRSLCAIKADER